MGPEDKQVSDNIAELRPGCDPRKPSADTIEDLERLLADARSGHLVGIAYATVNRDGSQGTGWSGIAGTRHTVGTAIMMLFHRYSAAMVRGSVSD